MNLIEIALELAEKKDFFAVIDHAKITIEVRPYMIILYKEMHSLTMTVYYDGDILRRITSSTYGDPLHRLWTLVKSEKTLEEHEKSLKNLIKELS